MTTININSSHDKNFITINDEWYKKCRPPACTVVPLEMNHAKCQPGTTIHAQSLCCAVYLWLTNIANYVHLKKEQLWSSEVTQKWDKCKRNNFPFLAGKGSHQAFLNYRPSVFSDVWADRFQFLFQGPQQIKYGWEFFDRLNVLIKNSTSSEFWYILQMWFFFKLWLIFFVTLYKKTKKTK